jgi:hypothetical protein
MVKSNQNTEQVDFFVAGDIDIKSWKNLANYDFNFMSNKAFSI